MSLPDPIIGKKLGDYTIRSLLGRGGMARVYKGYDERLDRYAAVKVITSDFVATADETEYKDRFEREAKAIARLRHANIVGIYQFGDIDGLYYMAMHFLDGDDLRVKLKNHAEKSERMPAREILKMTREVCSALDYAHEHGVIHRDIKPSNIMMTSTGAALTDFGLALSTAEGTMGDTFGSAHYIAPEQAISSARAVPQSDLYSLGVVLYEAFTGKVPFDDPSVMSVALKHLNDPPPPPTLFNPDLSAAVENVLLRVLSKEPKDRYVTGKELAAAMEQALAAAGDDETTEIATATLQKHAQASREAEAQENIVVTKAPTPPPTNIATTQKHQEPQAGGSGGNSGGTPSEKSSESPTPDAKPKGASRLLPYGVAVIGILIIIMITVAIILLGDYNDDDGDNNAVVGIEGTDTDEGTEQAVGTTDDATATMTQEVSPEVIQETDTPDVTDSAVEVSDITDTPEPRPTNTVFPIRTRRVTITIEASDTPEPTNTSTRRPTNTRIPSNTLTPSPTDTPLLPTDTPEPSDTPTPEPTDTPDLPPDIELRYTTERIILNNVSGDLLDLRLLAFEGDQNGFFEASTWAERGFTSLSTFRYEGCIQVATDPSTVFDSRQDPDCRWYNYFIWETSPDGHFWLDTEGNTSFAVLLNGEVVAECPVAESTTRSTICAFALPD